MAHESFENDHIAQQLNRDFIAIKVDREERPDIDATTAEKSRFRMATSRFLIWKDAIFCQIKEIKHLRFRRSTLRRTSEYAD